MDTGTVYSSIDWVGPVEMWANKGETSLIVPVKMGADKRNRGFVSTAACGWNQRSHLLSSLWSIASGTR